VELLSREGEIAIAKRIEAGRNTMIAGLCESPLTFHAITIWRDELLSEDILLRDVIDLEATFGTQLDSDQEIEPLVEAGAGAAPRSSGPEFDADGNEIVREEEDEEDDQSSMSLAAMEAALKPRVLETPSPATSPRCRTCRTSACRRRCTRTARSRRRRRRPTRSSAARSWRWSTRCTSTRGASTR
jgi:hypothetical protein